jgi:hypothetical protein
MSDESVAKRTRSPINALKIINSIRAEKGLPKIGAKPAKVKLTKEAKEELFKKVVQDLFPDSLSSANYNFTEKNVKIALAEFEKRLKELQGETAPRAPYTGKPRGRKPKA